MLRILFLAAALIFCGASSAYATPAGDVFMSSFGGDQVAPVRKGIRAQRPARGTNAKPRKWCGWQMRQWFGGGPEYNVAWNWSKRGVPATPHVGAVVVWRHHVGYISGRSERGWIVTSGNDGGRIRARVRSLRGAVIRAI